MVQYVAYADDMVLIARIVRDLKETFVVLSKQQWIDDVSNDGRLFGLSDWRAIV